MEITKASGAQEAFSEHKLCNSLSAAGAPQDLVDETCRVVTEKLTPGSTTTHIWREALRYLAKKNLPVAARYNMRYAIIALGPAGFLFEQYVETLLQAMGYETKRNQMIPGKCVPHEVDVTGEKGGECFLLEVKLHHEFGTKVATDVVMYADARREDIERAGRPCTMWVFTNTKFTENAIQYAKCRNLKLTGWRYPKEGGLESLIAEYALYPVTVLPSVDRFAREQFARANMMLAQDIAPYTAGMLLKEFGISEKRGVKIVREAQEIISPQKAS